MGISGLRIVKTCFLQSYSKLSSDPTVGKEVAAREDEESGVEGETAIEERDTFEGSFESPMTTIRSRNSGVAYERQV